MSAADYFKYKTTLLPVIKEAYASLSRNHDLIVIEGAGSPAEINLNEQDIVNMGWRGWLRRPCSWWPISTGAAFSRFPLRDVMLLEEE
jgi:adenosylcobyric acid synthase